MQRGESRQVLATRPGRDLVHAQAGAEEVGGHHRLGGQPFLGAPRGRAAQLGELLGAGHPAVGQYLGEAVDPAPDHACDVARELFGGKFPVDGELHPQPFHDLPLEPVQGAQEVVLEVFAADGDAVGVNAVGFVRSHKTPRETLFSRPEAGSRGADMMYPTTNLPAGKRRARLAARLAGRLSACRARAASAGAFARTANPPKEPPCSPVRAPC